MTMLIYFERLCWQCHKCVWFRCLQNRRYSNEKLHAFGVQWTPGVQLTVGHFWVYVYDDWINNSTAKLFVGYQIQTAYLFVRDRIVPTSAVCRTRGETARTANSLYIYTNSIVRTATHLLTMTAVWRCRHPTAADGIIKYLNTETFK